MADESQGIVVEWNGNNVAEVISTGQSNSAPVIPTTHLTSAAAEKLIGAMDNGQLTLEVNWSAEDTAQKALRADRASRTKRTCKLYMADTAGEIITFDAYCTGVTSNIAVNQQVRGTLTLEIDGEITYSPLLKVNTDYVPATGVIVLGLDRDTFHATNSETTTNWSIDYGGSGLSGITGITRDSATAVSITLNSSAGTTTGFFDLTFQAEAAALQGSYASGILDVTITAGAGPAT